MKKILIIAMIVIAAVFLFTAQSCVDTTPSGSQQNREAATRAEDRAVIAVPVPPVNHFSERQTVARWIETFDTPNITCYIYIINYGNILGYYVTNGKPVSNQSYITPSYEEKSWNGSITITRELMDPDGTFGENQPGIRFFTASGIAVEWGGSGATYLFSTQKLPINAPELGR